MSLEQMTDAFNEVMEKHGISMTEILLRLEWLMDNEVPDGWEEIGQDYCEDIVSDPEYKSRRFYHLDRRDFQMFRALWKCVLDLKNAKESE